MRKPAIQESRLPRWRRAGLSSECIGSVANTGGQRQNAYDFAGLIKEATPYAKEALQERETKKKEDGELVSGCASLEPMRT
jgi:hypothetical protein